MLNKYNDVGYVSTCKSSDIVTVIKEYHRLIIIDIPRSAGDFCPFGAVEQIKNGLVTNGKLLKEAQVINFAPPHVWVFSNSLPDKSKLSGDRWDIVHLI